MGYFENIMTDGAYHIQELNGPGFARTNRDPYMNM